MRRALLASLALSTLPAAAQTVPFTPQDRIVLGLVGGPPAGPEGTAFTASFQSVKVWLTQPGRTPDWRMPDRILALAWHDPDHNGYDPIKRVTFNGYPLTVTPLSNPNVRNAYALNQPVTPDYEEWLNWYAYLTDLTFPRYVALDSDYGRPGATLAYPSPYRLDVNATLRVGNVPWRYEIAPVARDLPAAEYATVTLYPSRTRENLTGLADHLGRPGTVLRDIPADRNLAGLPGWQVGALPGYASVSACNTRTVAFAGGKKVLFKACTVVVNAVTLNVVR